MLLVNFWLHNSGHRYYDESDVKQLLGIQPIDKKVIVYCRVSSHNQKDDLQSQIKAMEQFCLSAAIPVAVTEDLMYSYIFLYMD